MAINIVSKTRKISVTALFIAIGTLLPIFFHMMTLSGRVFLPMHIPVFLCGLLCGPVYGGICGGTTVFLSSFITGMPPLYPTACSMSLELASYGAISGILYKKTGIFPTLAIAMVAGRVVLAFTTTILLGLNGKPFVLETFITSAFVTSFPGLLIQFISIPIIISALERFYQNGIYKNN